MTRFQLVVRPDGRAILTTTEALSSSAIAELQHAVRGWSEGRWPVLVLPETEVITVGSVELDLDPSPAEVRREWPTEGAPA